MGRKRSPVGRCLVNTKSPAPEVTREKEDNMEKFTKGYVDVVVSMRTNKSEARKFLHRQLYEMRNEITREHYYEMYEYITNATAP